MKIIKDIQQGTPEWHACRIGKMTASNASAIGNCGKGLETYIRKIVSEKYSSAERENYSNTHTDRGHELEPIAISMYELMNNCIVEKVGFVEMNDYVGCSPDGLVGEDGGIEIKCPMDTKYIDMMIDQKPDSEYIWQVQMNLLITGRKWWDLVYYNPNFEKSSIIFRIEPDQEKFDALLSGFEIGTNRINELTAILTK
jgi:putative phage-type endonuclease